MSQDFHQGVYNFSNGYERSPNMKQQQGGDWISQRDMLKVQGFELQQQVQVEVSGGPQVYDAGGMLTEVIDSFPPGRKLVNNHILEGQIHQPSYRWSQKQPLAVAVNEPVLPLMSPHLTKASSSSPTCSTSVLPNSLASHQQHLHHQGYQVENPASQFSWIRGGGASEVDDPTGPKIGRNMEGQGLSLSLSSSLPNLEAAKFQELKIGGDGGMCFYDIQGVGVGPSMNFYGFKNHQETNHQHPMGFSTTDYQIHVGHPASSRIGNVLRNSRFLRAAQELLEEFCCVGRGQFKSPTVAKSQNGNPRSISSGDGGGPVASSTSKDRPPLSAAEKHEYQRKKVKLLAMLDEVDARYTHYCEQMQAIVSSFDSVLGYGAAAPYTILAQKAMSRHFRSIKDAILAQVKATCEVLGDKEVAGTICLTKGETPRLKLLDQKFRQQKALHQLGMLDLDTWRPQRGLPERSVNILRAWLFEHFLHPYPSDADKHLLSRQTGLSKNQVSNWFINARVRLWKPMVEDIYKEEAKDEGQDQQTTANHAANELAKSEDDDSEDHQSQTQTQAHCQSRSQNQKIVSAQTPMQHCKITTAPKATTISSSTATLGEGLGRSEINAAEKDPSKNIINYGQYTLGNQAILQGTPTTSTLSIISPTAAGHHHHHHHDNDDDDQTIMPTYGCFMGISPDAGGMYGGRASLPEFGTQAAGDVSLTLGLRHSTNVPRKSTTDFSIRDFGAY